ncbi:metallophosphoesterase family protein [Patescibacteria group bacterium]
MKIAIISDTHDNLPNFKKAIGWVEKEKIKTIIHCGDICTSKVLKEVTKNFPGKIYLVFGNADGARFRTTRMVCKKIIPKVILCGEWGKIKIGGKKIAFVHSPEFARGLASTKKYDLVFYGHTHKPWEEKIKSCRLVNPGNLAGLFYKATFAVYDTKKDKLELRILEKLK